MEYRRRLIALHPDERGYSPQGKRGSGLVSIEVKGDTAFVSVTARDLIRPQNGTYIAVLFPCNAQTMPYVLGEIDYNERSMQLHKSIITSNMPYDIDDYRAAAIIFVGTHINFVLVGQSGCNLDWMRVKSNLRLKGPGCLMPNPHRRPGRSRGTISSNISNYEDETSNEELSDMADAKFEPIDIPEDVSLLDNKTSKTLEVKDTDKPKNQNDDMPLKDYGKLHFVDNSGNSSVGSMPTNAPYVLNELGEEQPFEQVSAAKNEPIAEKETFEARGFDYSELTKESEEDQPTDSHLEGLLAEEGENDEIPVAASVHYDKGIKHSSIKEEVDNDTLETSTHSDEIEIEDANGFDYTELIDASKETTETKASADAVINEDTDNTSQVLSNEIEDATGFDYPELSDASEDENVSAKAALEDDDLEESLNEIKEVNSSEVESSDEDVFSEDSQETLSQDTQSKDASSAQERSYMASMSNEEYLKALDPFSSEKTEETSKNMHEDIDPCIYSKRDVRQKMNTCKRYGKRLPVRPFPAMTNSKWYKVEYPGMGSSFHYLIGSIHDDKGNVQVRCTAVPGPYGINPPAGLTGFTHYMTAQGMGNAGYWISFVNPKTGRPMDVV